MRDLARVPELAWCDEHTARTDNRSRDSVDTTCQSLSTQDMYRRGLKGVRVGKDSPPPQPLVITQ